MLCPVALTRSAMAEVLSFLVRALKCLKPLQTPDYALWAAVLKKGSRRSLRADCSTYRYYRFCSSCSLLQSALNDLQKIFLQNGYPQGIINYHINDVLNKNRQHQHSNPVSTVLKKDIIILFPYLGLQNNKVAKRLKSFVYKFYSCVNVKVVFQSTRCIKSFFPYKERIIVHNNPELFTEQIAGFVMVFSSVKLNDAFMIEKPNILRPEPR